MEYKGVEEFIPNEWKSNPDIPFVAIIAKSQTPKWPMIELTIKSLPHVNKGSEKKPLYVVAVKKDKESISKFRSLLELTMNMSNCFVFIEGYKFFKPRWTLSEILDCYIRSFDVNNKKYWCREVKILGKGCRIPPQNVFLTITVISPDMPKEERERLLKKEKKENKEFRSTYKLILPCKYSGFVRKFVDSWGDDLQDKFEEFKKEILSDDEARVDFVKSVALEVGCFYCPNFNPFDFSIQQIHVIVG